MSGVMAALGSVVLDGVPIGLPELAAGTMALALNGYVLLGGADFGGGVWDLLARGPRRAAHRALVADALAPIWEANHVWLILVVVLCFTCFPPAFARLATVLHVPLTLMLIGIVLRGSTFVFRAYDVPTRGDGGERRAARWGRPFAIASLLTPLVLGASLGAIASGAVGLVDARRGSFTERFVVPWTTPFAIAVGVLTLCVFALLAATYLTVEAVTPHDGARDAHGTDPSLADPSVGRALADDFRARAIGAQVATLIVAAVTVYLAPESSAVREVIAGGAWSLTVRGLATLCAVSTLAALWQRRWRVARFAAQAEASCLVWGWAWAQFPDVIPPHGTAATLAAPPLTLALTLGALALGTAVLLPSFVYLFRVFKGTA